MDRLYQAVDWCGHEIDFVSARNWEEAWELLGLDPSEVCEKCGDMAVHLVSDSLEE